jgi:hypothetical protein
MTTRRPRISARSTVFSWSVNTKTTMKRLLRAAHGTATASCVRAARNACHVPHTCLESSTTLWMMERNSSRSPGLLEKGSSAFLVSVRAVRLLQLLRLRHTLHDDELPRRAGRHKRLVAACAQEEVAQLLHLGLVHGRVCGRPARSVRDVTARWRTVTPQRCVPHERNQLTARRKSSGERNSTHGRNVRKQRVAESVSECVRRSACLGP